MGSTSSIRAVIFVAVNGALTWGCELSSEQVVTQNESVENPTSMDQCSELKATQARQDCAYAFLDERRDDAEVIQEAVAQLPEAIDRDMVLYRLAFNYPSIANRFCDRVTTEAFIEKCTQVMGRPHLSSTPGVQKKPKVQKPGLP